MDSSSQPPHRPAVAPRQVYTLADFARFAPRTALDLVRQLPSFAIRESESSRGLGQVTGNVLIDGERSGSKADDLQTQLARIPAVNVTRIELVDGASLDLPGLTGQVAVVYVQGDRLAGQFAWEPRFRAAYGRPLLTRGSVSISGKSGAIEYEAGLSNLIEYTAAGGRTDIFDAAGTVTELRDEGFEGHDDQPKLAAKLTHRTTGGAVARLSGYYQRKWYRYDEQSRRTGPGLPDRLRTTRVRQEGWNYELTGDYEFGLGVGRLKVIGLHRSAHEPYAQTVITDFGDAAPPAGDQFIRIGRTSETIARAEYGWRMLGGDFQLAGEAAFNGLDSSAAVGVRGPGGGFALQPFLSGTGKVSEDRYDGSLSFSRGLGPSLSLQLVAGAEHSTIAQSDGAGLSRSFFRPKGQASLAWRPNSAFDLSLKVQRRVGQLSFYDFLARVFLDNENANAANSQLVPQQDWTFEAEANRRFGRWGSARLRLTRRHFEDYVTIVPVGPAGEAVGNVPIARSDALDFTGTLELAPLGWSGARLNASVTLQRSRLRDPFTGRERPFSNANDRMIRADLRHDIRGTDWAWGGDFIHLNMQPGFRRNEIDLTFEGPNFLALFVEHKDVFGLTARLRAGNLLGGRSYRDRIVYAGLRGASPITYVERRDRGLGANFEFTIKGNF